MLSATSRADLQTIYIITVEADPVVGARLAEKFDVSPASVTEMLHRLERNGYLTVDRATGTAQTDRGIAEAEASLRRHRPAERFLCEVLGMDRITGRDPAQSACTIEVQGQQAILNSALAAKIWVAVQDESGHPALQRGGAGAPPHAAADTDQQGRADALHLVHHHATMEQAS
jgi:DtxR family Mn-dependent transcriptional regulator